MATWNCRLDESSGSSKSSLAVDGCCLTVGWTLAGAKRRERALWLAGTAEVDEPLVGGWAVVGGG